MESSFLSSLLSFRWLEGFWWMVLSNNWKSEYIQGMITLILWNPRITNCFWWNKGRERVCSDCEGRFKHSSALSYNFGAIFSHTWSSVLPTNELKYLEMVLTFFLAVNVAAFAIAIKITCGLWEVQRVIPHPSTPLHPCPLIWRWILVPKKLLIIRTLTHSGFFWRTWAFDCLLTQNSNFDVRFLHAGL